MTSSPTAAATINKGSLHLQYKPWSIKFHISFEDTLSLSIMDDFAPERKAGLPVVTEVKEIMQEISHTLSSTSHPDAEERRKRVFKVKSKFNVFTIAQELAIHDMDFAETDLLE